MTNSERIRGLLKAGCLLSLQKTGLGCLHWTQRAAQCMGVSVIQMMLYMATGNNFNTNDEMLRVLINFADPVANQYSWPWARMFANEAFLELSLTKNPMYASIMMSILVGGKADDPMWSIASFKNENIKLLKERAISVALAIRNDIDKKVAESASTEESKLVWKGSLTARPNLSTPEEEDEDDMVHRT